jgi:hypothetical protein
LTLQKLKKVSPLFSTELLASSRCLLEESLKVCGLQVLPLQMSVMIDGSKLIYHLIEIESEISIIEWN